MNHANGNFGAGKSAHLAAARTFSFSEWMEEQARHTPWWALSVAFHLLVMIMLMAFKMGGAVEAPLIPIRMVVLPPQQLQPLNTDPPVESPAGDISDEPRTEDPLIPDAEPDAPPQTADDKPFEEVKGNGDALKGERVLGESGENDGMGMGSGAGEGLKGRRGRFRKTGTGGPGGGKDWNAATMRGLRWLARHQNPDGYWEGDGFHSQCKGTICTGTGYEEFNVGLTGLALLAFLGAGYTQQSKEVFDGIKFGNVVKNGLLWLQRRQDVEGLFGDKNSSKHMYNHAIATIAMCEAYGMSTRTPLFEKSARRGIEYLLGAQTKYRGWRYESQAPDNDMSVTGWCVMALKSAELADMKIGESAYQWAMNLLNELTESQYFRVGYQRREDAGSKVFDQGRNEQYQHHEAMTAIGMLLRMYAEGNQKDPILKAQMSQLMQDLPEWNKEKLTNDYYYWYYATLALFMYDGPDTKHATQKYWKEWSKAIDKAVRLTQKTKADKCAEGSWDADDRWSYEGGRVYATAINTLTLEVLFRYPGVFTGKEKEVSK